MQVVTIDRSKLLDGSREDAPDTLLLNNKGESCALGFYARQVLKLPAGLLLNRGSIVERVFGVAPDMPETKWLTDGIEDRICATNDDPLTSAGYRERKLKALFKTGDVTLRFVGRRPKA